LGLQPWELDQAEARQGEAEARRLGKGQRGEAWQQSRGKRQEVRGKRRDRNIDEMWHDDNVSVSYF
jgi:hypothetical protein